MKYDCKNMHLNKSLIFLRQEFIRNNGVLSLIFSSSFFHTGATSKNVICNHKKKTFVFGRNDHVLRNSAFITKSMMYTLLLQIYHIVPRASVIFSLTMYNICINYNVITFESVRRVQRLNNVQQRFP